MKPLDYIHPSQQQHFFFLNSSPNVRVMNIFQMLPLGHI